MTERYGPDNARVTNAGVQTYYRVRENFRTSSSKWLLIIMGNTVVSFFMLGYIAYAIGTGLVADFRAAGMPCCAWVRGCVGAWVRGCVRVCVGRDRARAGGSAWRE